MFVMQTSAMKTCFQIDECSFSFAKLSNISVTSKYLTEINIIIGQIILNPPSCFLKRDGVWNPQQRSMSFFLLGDYKSPGFNRSNLFYGGLQIRRDAWRGLRKTTQLGLFNFRSIHIKSLLFHHSAVFQPF